MTEFNKKSLSQLSERTEYESFFLEAVYTISQNSLFEKWPDKLIYPPNGKDPKRIAMGAGVAILGDWRREFLGIGAPLIFVTGFKLLDMIVEWILDQNGITHSSSFKKKKKQLRSVSHFPIFISSRQWLQTRLIELYTQIEPLRGTVIHEKSFKSTNGSLTVASSRGKGKGPEVSISPEQLKWLALFSISLLKFLDASWSHDAYREKWLRRTLDELAFLHKEPSLNQQTPYFLTARAPVVNKNSVTIDRARIQLDVAKELPNYDVVFDLRIIAIDPETCVARSYLLPWGFIQADEKDFIEVSIQDLEKYETELPDDIDSPKVMLAELLKPQTLRPVVG